MIFHSLFISIFVIDIVLTVNITFLSDIVLTVDITFFSDIVLTVYI